VRARWRPSPRRSRACAWKNLRLKGKLERRGKFRGVGRGHRQMDALIAAGPQKLECHQQDHGEADAQQPEADGDEAEKEAPDHSSRCSLWPQRKHSNVRLPFRAADSAIMFMSHAGQGGRCSLRSSPSMSIVSSRYIVPPFEIGQKQPAFDL
jgi:hypothetical protein